MSDATEAWEAYERTQAMIFPDDAFLAGFAAGQVAALEDAADEQDRLSTGPRAMGSKAVQFKRIIFANWLRARAAELSKETP